MTEQIKDVVGFEGLYKVTVDGRIFSVRNNRFINSYDDSHGYRVLQLSYNGVSYRKKVHRLVAEAFIKKIEGKNIVNHLDRNPSNNNVSNLEWCTHSENVQHGYDSNPNRKRATGHIGRFAEDNHTSIFVLQLDKRTLSTIKLYGSGKQAERETGINSANLSAAAKGKRKTAGGYAWRQLKRIEI